VRAPSVLPRSYGWGIDMTDEQRAELASPPRRGRRVWRLLAALAAVPPLLVLGVQAVSPPARVPVLAPVAVRQQPSGTSQRIAHRYDSAIVDVNTVLVGGQAAGTGVVLTSDGEILTNYHVVEGSRSITVTISNGARRFAATVIGSSPSADVALLRARGASGLSTVRLGRSSAVAVGDRVVAIGNALNEPGPPTVTEGNVTGFARAITVRSRLGRDEELQNLIATDAELAPGNSGGPLFDARGEVIGINTAADTHRFSTVGDGYAIPIEDALRIVRRIQAGDDSRDVRIGARAFLGVTVRAGIVTGRGTRGSGVFVSGVANHSAADAASIAPGDRITALGGVSLGSSNDLTDVMDTKRPGDRVRVRWIGLDGKPHAATVRLGRSPVA
jgi:S1-C subfamily serine protease